MSAELFSPFLKLKILRFLAIWLFAYIAFTLALSIFIDVRKAAFISLLLILPLVPSVHLNYYFIDHFFLKRKYWQYFTLFIVLSVVFGFIAQLIMNKFHNTDGEYIGAMLNPFMVVLVTTSIKGFKENLQNNYKIVEARASQAETELKLAEAESKQIRAELNLLKAQVNPHFLFNTLNSIYSLAIDNSSNTSQAIMLLSKLMRYHLEASKTPKVLLSEEVGFINSYIKLEKLRLSNKCSVNFEVKGVKDSHYLPPMFLIPLVENCFKHGISIEKKKNEIYIKIFVEGNHLEFSTVNSVPGKEGDYPDDKKEKTGIANIEHRLKLLYNNKCEFVTKQRGGKFYTNLIIEL